MDKHCVSLEIAKELKEAGWNKKTEFSYCDTADKRFNENAERYWLYPKETVSARKYNSKGKDIQYPAPLATEILEELPKFMTITKLDDNNYSVLFLGTDIQFMDINLCNALAKMWLYLKKENLC